jgi:BirA family biotin operon repressor/biotin-[acetyl-CoA-carboxylase] ligase
MAENELSPEIILRGLKTRFIGQKIIYFPSLGSTMEAAKREALWGAEAGTIVITDEQMAGKGRLQRSWISPRGGLALSIILRPNIDHLPYMVMIASLAVVYSIQRVTGIKSVIKWPNDVMIKFKKVSGILIENDIRKNTLRHTIIGIGVNVNFQAEKYPEIAPIATSLSDELKKEVSRLEVLQQLLVEMDRLYQLLPETGVILEQWTENLVTLGQKVEVMMGDKIYKGKVESVTKDGSIMLRQDGGGLIKIIAGDVSLG